MFYYFLLESLTSKLRELGYPFTMGISPLKTVRRTVFRGEIPVRVTFYARHLLKSVYKEKSTTSNEVVLFGDPYGNRTSIILQISFNAIRTNDNFITGMDFIKGYFYICVVQSVVLFI